MERPSPPIVSSQVEPHQRLLEVVDRHRDHAWQKPISAHTREAFDAVMQGIGDDASPLILDSGCGTGESTRIIGEVFSDHWVIGVDQSAHRLRKSGVDQVLHRQDQVILVRAEVADFWRLAVDCGWRLARHYVLYPNPWPKPSHLARRWHGHPAFCYLIRLGGEFELRTNWRVYMEECRLAMERYGVCDLKSGPCSPQRIVTPFERKYRASGHPLWSLRADLG